MSWVQASAGKKEQMVLVKDPGLIGHSLLVRVRKKSRKNVVNDSPF